MTTPDSPPADPKSADPAPADPAVDHAVRAGLEVALHAIEDYEELGLDWADVVRTLVIRLGRGQYAFALVPMGHRIAWPRLRAELGVNRTHLPDEEEAFEATGYRRGTITPLGARGDWPVIADARVPGRLIGLGSGVAGRALWTRADPLLAALDARVADIADPG